MYRIEHPDKAPDDYLHTTLYINDGDFEEDD